MGRHYIVWYTDNDGEKEYENYIIILAESLDYAKKQAETAFGDYVISVEPYEP